MFTIFGADCIGNEFNCIYPHRKVVLNEDDLKAMFKRDYVCAEYRNNYRNSPNFIGSNCLPLDCDNDHSNIPDEWVTPDDIARDFPDIAFAVHYSRHHNKEKNGESARPRFHVLFPIEYVTDAQLYKDMKTHLNEIYPYFDKKALDASRFFFGTENPQVEIRPGKYTMTDFFRSEEFDRNLPQFGEIHQGSRNSTMSRFAGTIIKRLGDNDEAFNAFIEKSNSCVPPLETDELMSIWRSAKKFYKNVILKSPDYIPPEMYQKESTSIENWDEPLPLSMEKLPPFPIDSLPDVLKNYALAISESTQTPVDMAATALLTITSACMRNLYKIEGKADWLEPTNLYSVIIAEPSERKSAVISACIKAVNKYVSTYNKEHALEFEMSRTTKQRLENKRTSLISASKKKGTPENADDFNDELQAVISELVNFEEKKPLKVYIDDTTPEKLTETLEDNNGAISIISSEGGIFDVLSGSYSNRVNIDVFLKAYSGETISVERIMRSSVHVDEACLTILLSVQPVVIGDLMSNKKFKLRGLTARFLYARPTSFIGERQFTSNSVNPDVYKAYEDLVFDILKETKGESENIIKLSEEARVVLKEFYEWVEDKLVGEFSLYADWLGKLVGNTLRIAAVLARSQTKKSHQILADDEQIIVDTRIMQNAINIGKYFLVHSINTYGEMGVRSGMKSAIKALEKIKEKQVLTLTKRDLQRLCRWIKTADDSQEILDILEDNGYVRLTTVDNADRCRNGRPKNAVYSVNCRIFNS